MSTYHLVISLCNCHLQLFFILSPVLFPVKGWYGIHHANEKSLESAEGGSTLRIYKVGAVFAERFCQIMMAILTCLALRHFLVRVRASVARVRAVQSGLKHTFYVDKPFVFL